MVGVGGHLHGQLAAGRGARRSSGPARSGGRAPSAARRWPARRPRRRGPPRWPRSPEAEGHLPAPRGRPRPPAWPASCRCPSTSSAPSSVGSCVVSSPGPQPRSTTRPPGTGCTRATRSKKGRLRSAAKRSYCSGSHASASAILVCYLSFFRLVITALIRRSILAPTGQPAQLRHADIACAPPRRRPPHHAAPRGGDHHVKRSQSTATCRHCAGGRSAVVRGLWQRQEVRERCDHHRWWRCHDDSAGGATTTAAGGDGGAAVDHRGRRLERPVGRREGRRQGRRGSGKPPSMPARTSR